MYSVLHAALALLLLLLLHCHCPTNGTYCRPAESATTGSSIWQIYPCSATGCVALETAANAGEQCQLSTEQCCCCCREAFPARESRAALQYAQLQLTCLRISISMKPLAGEYSKAWQSGIEQTTHPLLVGVPGLLLAMHTSCLIKGVCC